MLYPKITIENKKNTNLFYAIGKVIPEFAVFNEVIIRSHHNTRIFMSSEKIYDEIAQNTGYSRFKVKRILMNLKESGFLLKLGQGKYKLNPELIKLDYKNGTWIGNYN